MDNSSFLQIAYDIAMSIGVEKEFLTEVKNVLRILIKRLNANGVAIFFNHSIVEDLDLEHNYLSVPQKIKEKSKFASIDFDINNNHYQDEGTFVYGFELDKVGHLVIIKKSDFEMQQKKVIEELTTKLARSLDALANKKRILIAKKMAEKANESKGLFLANMSHEIRTPLNAIIGITSLLMESKIQGKEKERIHKIQISSNALLTLVNDILDFSKIEAGEMILEEVRFDLRAVLEESVSIFDEQLTEKKIKFNCRIDEKLNSWFVGDPTRIRQIIFNLISNAIKFTDLGSINLEAKVQTSFKDHIGVKISVQDTGIGIPENKQKNLFKPFSQADFSTTRKYGGTGLGLSICRHIVDMMNGAIGVSSQIGKGSTFWFTLGLQKSISEEISGAHLSRRSYNNIQRNCKILIVEDNSMNQELMAMILENLDQSFDIAENGYIGVQMCEEEKYDLVLMDCQMPVMDGFEATRSIRESEARTSTRTPIIAMTANAMKGDREKCLTLGMDDYLTKPVTIDSVKDTLCKWLPIVEDKNLNKERPMEKPKNPKSEITIDADNDHIDPTAIDMLKSLISKQNPTFLTDRLNTFYANAPADIDNMQKAAQEDNWERVKSIAHKFKTSCGIVGAKIMSQLCLEIETASNPPQPEYIRKKIVLLAEEYEIVKSHLETLH